MRRRYVLVVSDLAQRLPERILRLTLVVRPMQYDRTLCNCRFHGCPRPRETPNKMHRSYCPSYDEEVGAKKNHRRCAHQGTSDFREGPYLSGIGVGMQ